MTKDDMGELLETMLNDPEVADRVAEGDFGELQDGKLTEAEKALLVAAGSELAEDVVGFQKSYLKLGDIEGESQRWKISPGAPQWNIEQGSALRGATDYLGHKIYKFG